jgi:predicted ATPase
MIKSVRLKNFKSFREAEIPLERFTVFVGANGSGKTTVLEAVRCLSAMTVTVGKKNLVYGLFKDRFSPSQILRKGSTDCMEFGCDVESAGKSSSLRCAVAFQGHSQSDRISKWLFSATRDQFPPWILRVEEQPESADSGDPSTNITDIKGYESNLDFPISPGLLLRLNARDIIEPSEDDKLEISESGRGIAAVLVEMALSQPDQFKLLQVAVNSVIPAFERVRMIKTTLLRTENLVYRDGERTITQPVGRRLSGHKLILDMKNAADIPGGSASEGTLLVIAIFTLLMGPSQPKLLLLDDIDRGLHPKAMGDLVKVIRKLMEQDPELQIIATSHSPYLLDHLEYKEVRLTSLDADGVAHVGMLSDYPEFEQWKDVMRPGELWSTVGEDWLTENGKKSNG